jgi:DNA invertase Pin-like site-specific DNA recombinase
MQKAYSYLRVSGRSQVEGDGLVRQREAIARYAATNDIDVVDEFRDEGVSGTKDLADRQGLATLFDRVDANGVRLVLVERADRLARDLIIGEVLLGQFRDRGVTVVEAEAGQDLTVADGDPTRKLIRQLLGAIAEFDKTCVVLKLRVARDRKRRSQGRCEGPKPYGSKPGEAEVAERIRLLRLDGLTLAAIAGVLNVGGIATRNGKAWSKSMVKRVVDRFSCQLSERPAD